mmetsp:Transcript_50122/g.144396  ORF Transcript_50122/g.144396 Transcript_50122/m.144396 type:complete len:390 (+) Transcript_50122:4009-5178(+)
MFRHGHRPLAIGPFGSNGRLASARWAVGRKGGAVARQVPGDAHRYARWPEEGLPEDRGAKTADEDRHHAGHALAVVPGLATDLRRAAGWFEETAGPCRGLDDERRLGARLHPGGQRLLACLPPPAPRAFRVRLPALRPRDRGAPGDGHAADDGLPVDLGLAGGPLPHLLRCAIGLGEDFQVLKAHDLHSAVAEWILDQDTVHAGDGVLRERGARFQLFLFARRDGRRPAALGGGERGNGARGDGVPPFPDRPRHDAAGVRAEASGGRLRVAGCRRSLSEPARGQHLVLPILLRAPDRAGVGAADDCVGAATPLGADCAWRRLGAHAEVFGAPGGFNRGCGSVHVLRKRAGQRWRLLAVDDVAVRLVSAHEHRAGFDGGGPPGVGDRLQR